MHNLRIEDAVQEVRASRFDELVSERAMPGMQPSWFRVPAACSGALATAFAFPEIQHRQHLQASLPRRRDKRWIPAYRGLGATRVAPVGPSAGPNLGLVNTTWDGRRLLEGPVWVEVLPEAQGALDPDRSRHRTQTRETLGVWQRFHQVSGKYDPKSFWKPKQAVYRCRHESPAGIIAINDGNGSPSRAGWGDER